MCNTIIIIIIIIINSLSSESFHIAIMQDVVYRGTMVYSYLFHLSYCNMSKQVSLAFCVHLYYSEPVYEYPAVLYL